MRKGNARLGNSKVSNGRSELHSNVLGRVVRYHQWMPLTQQPPQLLKTRDEFSSEIIFAIAL